MNCRTIIASIICAACLPAVAEARDSTLVLDDNDNNNIISGTITRVEGDSVFVDYSGREIEVDMDDIDMEGSISNFFAPGMTISAKGSFEDEGHTPVLDAREVVRSDAGSDPVTGAILLEDND